MWDWIKKAGTAIVGGIPSLIGSIVQSNSAKKTNEDQIELAKDQFAATKAETDSAHQREVKDLRAAGLNPILSAKYGGSASAQAQVPNLKTPWENAGRDFSSASQVALNTLMTKAQIRREMTQSDVNSAQEAKLKSEKAILDSNKTIAANQAEINTKEKQSKTNWFRRNISLPIGQAFKDLNPFHQLFTPDYK